MGVLGMVQRHFEVGTAPVLRLSCGCPVLPWVRCSAALRQSVPRTPHAPTHDSETERSRWQIIAWKSEQQCPDRSWQVHGYQDAMARSFVCRLIPEDDCLSVDMQCLDTMSGGRRSKNQSAPF